MPKYRRVRCLSLDQFKASPYRPSSSDAKQCQSKNSLALGIGSAKDVKEWDDARCPICMEHPHNAVLLQCSSFEKGCRPFMCNTSYRHSNCLDQYRKSSKSSPSTANLQGNPSGNMASISFCLNDSSLLYGLTEAGNSMQLKLLCPLCRGDIYGWGVVEPARHFMNSKTRNCSSEGCDFSGTYGELRKHARYVHPETRPTVVNPERQREWARMEREREYEDMLSLIQPVVGEESNGESISDLDDFHSWLTLNLAYLTLALEFIGDSRSVEQVEFRRRPGGRRFGHDHENDHATREHNTSLPVRAHTAHRDYPVPPMERFQVRHRSSQGRLHWRHHGSSSDRVLNSRHQSSQTNRARRDQGQGLRWRTQRWSSFNNGS